MPPSEPRAELALEVDLAPAFDCEERFDLALYEDRRIELIQWDERVGDCTARRIRIRYLTAKLTAAGLEELVGAIARKVRAP